jgi:hypothetical protein
VVEAGAPVTAVAIVAGIVTLGIGALIAADALRRPGDERDLEATHTPLTRADYEAETAAPVSDQDEAAAAPLLAYVEEIGSGEFPALAFLVDPLSAPLPDDVPHADPALFNASAAAWLLPAWPTAPTVPLSSVQVCEPDPLNLEGPTAVWSRDWITNVLAGGPR